MLKSNLLQIRNVDITRLDIDRIIYIIEALTKVLNDESEIIQKMKLSDFSENLEFKTLLIDELEVHNQIITKKPELIKQLDKDKLNRLRELNAAFEEAKGLNVKMLELAISVNKNAVQIVKKIIQDKMVAKSGYSKNGQYIANQSMESDMPPFNLNSKI